MNRIEQATDYCLTYCEDSTYEPVVRNASRARAEVEQMQREANALERIRDFVALGWQSPLSISIDDEDDMWIVTAPDGCSYQGDSLLEALEKMVIEP